jgi:catechol-2,3-dioxygenase
MPITALNHYNFRAPRALLDRLRDFYCGIVGLTEGERPPFRSFGYWLYAGGQPILHLAESSAEEIREPTAKNTLDHVAFTCTGRQEMEAHLVASGVPYRVAEVPQTKQVQLFLNDPAGNGVELNFSQA